MVYSEWVSFKIASEQYRWVNGEKSSEMSRSPSKSQQHNTANNGHKSQSRLISLFARHMVAAGWTGLRNAKERGHSDST